MKRIFSLKFQNLIIFLITLFCTKVKIWKLIQKFLDCYNYKYLLSQCIYIFRKLLTLQLTIIWGEIINSIQNILLYNVNDLIFFKSNFVFEILLNQIMATNVSIKVVVFKNNLHSEKDCKKSYLFFRISYKILIKSRYVCTSTFNLSRKYTITSR